MKNRCSMCQGFSSNDASLRGRDLVVERHQFCQMGSAMAFLTRWITSNCRCPKYNLDSDPARDSTGRCCHRRGARQRPAKQTPLLLINHILKPFLTMIAGNPHPSSPLLPPPTTPHAHAHPLTNPKSTPSPPYSPPYHYHPPSLSPHPHPPFPSPNHQPTSPPSPSPSSPPKSPS